MLLLLLLLLLLLGVLGEAGPADGGRGHLDVFFDMAVLCLKLCITHAAVKSVRSDGSVEDWCFPLPLLWLLLLLLRLHALWQGRSLCRVRHGGGGWGQVGIVPNHVGVVHRGKATHSGLGLGAELKGKEILTHDMGFRHVVGRLSVGVSTRYIYSLSNEEFDSLDFSTFGSCMEGAISIPVFGTRKVGAHLEEGVDHGLVAGLTGRMDG